MEPICLERPEREHFMERTFPGSPYFRHNCKLLILFCAGYFGNNLMTHFVASMISGLATTAASMPVDITKTRYVSSCASFPPCLL